MCHRRRLFLFILSLITLSALTNSISASSIGSGESILLNIQVRGAEYVYKQYDSQDEWNAVLGRIETGDKDWLKVAVAFYQVSDAGPAEMLIYATGVALAKSPHNALAIAAPAMSIEGVCGYPDMADPRFETKKQTLAYLDARIDAVSNLNQKDISDRKEQCLEMLHKTRKEVSGPKGPFS
jgi:hypothetical protein